MYTTTGIVLVIEREQRITEKFKKRIIVIETFDTYPQKLSFQAINNNCDMFDDLREGDEIEVKFHIHGKLWKDERYFNSLNVAGIKFIKHHQKVKGEKKETFTDQFTSQKGVAPDTSLNDDLPF